MLAANVHDDQRPRVGSDHDLFGPQRVRIMPEGSRSLRVADENRGGVPIRVALALRSADEEEKLFDIRALDYSDSWLNVLEVSDVLIISNTSSLSGNEATALQVFVKNGGGLLFIPGLKTDFKQLPARTPAPKSPDPYERRRLTITAAVKFQMKGKVFQFFS